MRVSLIGAVAGALCAACSSTAARPPPPAPADLHPYLAARPAGDAAAAPSARLIAEAYVAALTRPDFPSLAACLTEDAHFFFPGIEDVHGRGAVVHAHELFFGPFAERRIALRRVLRASSTQLLEWTLAGTQTDTWFDVIATHKAVVFEGLSVLSTRDDGTVSDEHVYFDIASVKAQLGSGPGELHALPPAPWPSEPAQVVEQTGSPDEIENTALVRRWLDALSSIDRGAYLASLSKDVEVKTPESAKPVHGKEAAGAYFDTIHQELAQLDSQVDAIWAVGPFVGLEYSISGQQIAPIGWVPLVHDRVVRLQIADVVEVDSARITRVWRYDNLAQANAPGP